MKSWGAVAAHINKKTAVVKGVTLEKRVQVLIFFAHGTPGTIWLSAKERLYLGAGEVASVDASAFLDDNGSDAGQTSGYRAVSLD